MEPTPNDPPSTDATPQEPSLCDWLRAKASEMRQGESTFLDCVSAREYDDVAEIARPWEQRRIAAEQQAAALRARLETAETALRRIAYETSNISSETVANIIFNIAAAALKPDDQPPALCGDREGECVCNLPKSHDGNHEDCVEGQETVGWENVPAPRRRWWCEEGGDG